MESNPRLITILCSTYNSSKWIDGYLQSINDQILKNFDIVFVDANSNDGSLQTIKNFKFRDGINSKILEYRERISIYDAWNIAINEAETPYVVNVNTDDRLFNAGLHIYQGYCQAAGWADIIYGTYLVVSDAHHHRFSGLRLCVPHSHNLLLQGCYVGPFPLLKKESIVDDGMFDPKYTISGDYEMWLRMSKKNRKFLHIVEPVGSYFDNPEGMSTNRESKHWQEHIRQDTEIRNLYK